MILLVRNIQVIGYLDENVNPSLEAAYINIFIPPTDLNNPNLPNDLQYISKLVGKLLPLPIGNGTMLMWLPLTLWLSKAEEITMF